MSRCYLFQGIQGDTTDTLTYALIGPPSSADRDHIPDGTGHKERVDLRGFQNRPDYAGIIR